MTRKKKKKKKTQKARRRNKMGDTPLPEQEKPATEPTMLEKAQEVAERIEKANAEHKELLEREERVKANALLGGKSEAGQAPEKPKEETPKEYAARIIRGGV